MSTHLPGAGGHWRDPLLPDTPHPVPKQPGNDLKVDLDPRYPDRFLLGVIALCKETSAGKIYFDFLIAKSLHNSFFLFGAAGPKELGLPGMNLVIVANFLPTTQH